MNLALSRFRRWQAERRARRRLAANHTDQHDAVDGADAIAVREALGELSEPQRTVLVLRYYLDLPVEETAELTGRSSSAVTSLTQRAIDALRTHVEVDDVDVREELGHE